MIQRHRAPHPPPQRRRRAATGMHLRAEDDNRVRRCMHRHPLAVANDRIERRDARRTGRTDGERANAESAHDDWNALAIHSC